MMIPESGDAATPYMPTPTEIAAGCLAIQATWTDHERASRRCAMSRLRVGNPAAVRMDAQTAIETKLANRREKIASGQPALDPVKLCFRS